MDGFPRFCPTPHPSRHTWSARRRPCCRSCTVRYLLLHGLADGLTRPLAVACGGRAVAKYPWPVRERCTASSRVLPSFPFPSLSSRFHPETAVAKPRAKSQSLHLASSYRNRRKLGNWIRNPKVAESNCSFARKRLYPWRAKNLTSRASPPFPFSFREDISRKLKSFPLLSCI